MLDMLFQKSARSRAQLQAGGGPPFYKKIVFVSYFNAGVRAFDIRDRYNSKNDNVDISAVVGGDVVGLDHSPADIGIALVRATSIVSVLVMAKYKTPCLRGLPLRRSCLLQAERPRSKESSERGTSNRSAHAGTMAQSRRKDHPLKPSHMPQVDPKPPAPEQPAESSLGSDAGKRRFGEGSVFAGYDLPRLARKGTSEQAAGAWTRGIETSSASDRVGRTAPYWPSLVVCAVLLKRGHATLRGSATDADAR